MAAFASLGMQVTGVLTPAELLLRDALLRGLPARPATRVAVVLVDDASLRSIGAWPWDRATLARLVDGVFAAGAKGIALDLLLPEARNGDPALLQALKQGPALLAAGLDESGRWVLPGPGLKGIPVAHVSFDLDGDGVVRRFTSTKEVEGRSLPAFPVAAARLDQPQIPVPVDRVLRPAFRSQEPPTFSAEQILHGDRPAQLRDRIVFLGTSAAGVGDRFVSPRTKGGSPEPGVMIEAAATEAVLSNDLLQRLPPLVTALMVFGLGAGMLFLSERVRPALAFVPLVIPIPLAAGLLHFLRLESATLATLVPLVLLGTWAGIERSRRTRLAFKESMLRIAKLVDLRDALEESRKQEAEARRVVAHELKTPLTSVRGLAQILAKFDLSAPERDRVVGMVVSETTRLAQMVDALLDLERLRLRAFERNAQALDYSALCAERVDFLRTGTEREIHADLAPGLKVRGDKNLLERVLENLVSNALKFSPEGSALRVRLQDHAHHAVLEVEDQGPGIPPEERERIFGRFARGSTQGLAPGLGLGLALVAEVVAWHHGTVEVEEAPDGGSLFRVRLPEIRTDRA